MPSIEAQRLMNGFRSYRLIAAACQLELPDLLSAGPRRTINEYRDFLALAGLQMTQSITTDSEFAAIEAVLAR